MTKGMTAMRAIRLKCLDCSCGQVTEVRACQITSCVLWPFRMGKNPNRQGLKNAGQFKPKAEAV